METTFSLVCEVFMTYIDLHTNGISILVFTYIKVSTTCDPFVRVQSSSANDVPSEYAFPLSTM